jgi:hypothetical protein
MSPGVLGLLVFIGMFMIIAIPVGIVAWRAPVRTEHARRRKGWAAGAGGTYHGGGGGCGGGADSGGGCGGGGCGGGGS